MVGCGSCDVYRRCGSVLELIVSVLLCPVLDTPSPWNEGRERLLDELGEGFIQERQPLHYNFTFYIVRLTEHRRF